MKQDIGTVVAFIRMGVRGPSVLYDGGHLAVVSDPCCVCGGRDDQFKNHFSTLLGWPFCNVCTTKLPQKEKSTLYGFDEEDLEDEVPS
jgi:hypothetical protein